MKLRNLLNNKRGAEIGFNAVIYLVIGLAVLVVAVVLIFDIGGYRTRLFTPSGGSSNVDQLRLYCRQSCDQINVAGQGSYSVDLRAVVFVDGLKAKLTCKQLESPVCITKAGLILNLEAKDKVDCENPKEGIWDAQTRKCMDASNPPVELSGRTAETCKTPIKGGIYEAAVITDTKCNALS